MLGVRAASGGGGDRWLRHRLQDPRGCKGFRKQWVYEDATMHNPMLLIPLAPVDPSSGWGHAELADLRLAHILSRLAKLKEAGVMTSMVVREFVKWRIAPL